MPKDETTGKAQDTSSDKAGQSSGSKGGTTSKDKGKLYTDADIAKIKSDAAAEAGRLRKAAEQERDSTKQELQSLTSRLDELERERNESRLAEVRGDPTKLSAYQSEQSAAKRQRDADAREREIARREAQVKADEEAISNKSRYVSVAEISAKHGIDMEELEELGISDPEQLEKVAEKLAAAKGTTAKPPEGGEGDEGGETFTPDSGDTTGAGELTEKQRLAQRYPTMNVK